MKTLVLISVTWKSIYFCTFMWVCAFNGASNSYDKNGKDKTVSGNDVVFLSCPWFHVFFFIPAVRAISSTFVKRMSTNLGEKSSSTKQYLDWLKWNGIICINCKIYSAHIALFYHNNRHGKVASEVKVGKTYNLINALHVLIGYQKVYDNIYYMI